MKNLLCSAKMTDLWCSGTEDRACLYWYHSLMRKNELNRYTKITVLINVIKENILKYILCGTAVDIWANNLKEKCNSPHGKMERRRILKRFLGFEEKGSLEYSGN